MVFFKFDKKEIFALIGGITGIAAAYKFPLILGIITLICGIIAKYQKSKYWSWAIILGIAAVILHFINLYSN